MTEPASPRPIPRGEAFGGYLESIGDRTASYRAARAITGGERALYPGSYLDIAPLNAWPEVAFVDSDRKFAKAVSALPAKPAGARFVVADYREPLAEVSDGWADVLISLYAGPVSRYCTRYLADGGYLLANNSHGDASLALLDPRYELVAVQPTWASARFRADNLDSFSRARRPDAFTVDQVLASGRGVAFERTAACYLFRLVGR